MNELVTKIEKIKKGIAIATPEQKPLLEKALVAAEAKLAEAQEEEKKTPTPKPKVKRKASQLSKEECTDFNKKLDLILAAINKDCEETDKAKLKVTSSSKRDKPKPKRASTILQEGITNGVSRVLKKEMTAEKVKKVNIDKLKEMKELGVKFLKVSRQAFGGVSSENDSFIKAFESDMNEKIKMVEEKQKGKEKENKK